LRVQEQNIFKILMLIKAFQIRGSELADLDPLKLDEAARA
jgi:2-oxoglutarate dehydrogenase complex dehydrogenase (E1) component-like enzyme